MAAEAPTVNRMVNRASDLLDGTFRSLSDPTRRAILARLESGRATVGDLAQPFDMSAPAISKHLKVLETNGLVRRDRDGRHHYLSLDPRPLWEADAWFTRHRRFWEVRLDALERHLRNKEEDPNG